MTPEVHDGNNKQLRQINLKVHTCIHIQHQTHKYNYEKLGFVISLS